MPDDWKCINCHDNFHEGCDDFMITRYGIVKCKCVCNRYIPAESLV